MDEVFKVGEEIHWVSEMSSFIIDHRPTKLPQVGLRLTLVRSPPLYRHRDVMGLPTFPSRRSRTISRCSSSQTAGATPRSGPGACGPRQRSARLCPHEQIPRGHQSAERTIGGLPLALLCSDPTWCSMGKGLERFTPSPDIGFILYLGAADTPPADAWGSGDYRQGPSSACAPRSARSHRVDSPARPRRTPGTIPRTLAPSSPAPCRCYFVGSIKCS
jgi:hypothetical protein